MINTKHLHDQIVEQDVSLEAEVLLARRQATIVEAAQIELQLAIHHRLGDLLEMLSLKR